MALAGVVITVDSNRFRVMGLEALAPDTVVVLGFTITDARLLWWEALVRIDADTSELLAVDGVLGFRLGTICPRDRMGREFDPTATWLRDAIELKLSEIVHRSNAGFPYADVDHARWLVGQR